MFSLLDVFLGYKQVLVVEQDRFKATFWTKWGIFTFKRISFGLINATTNFQRATSITSHGHIVQIIGVYLDDVILFSKKRSDHVCHLKQIFEWCQKYEIYLNPRKSFFDVFEGILLGNIIEKRSINIDPERVKAIT